MPKNLGGRAAVEDVLTIVRAELIALGMCISMSIYTVSYTHLTLPTTPYV